MGEEIGMIGDVDDDDIAAFRHGPLFYIDGIAAEERILHRSAVYDNEAVGERKPEIGAENDGEQRKDDRQDDGRSAARAVG